MKIISKFKDFYDYKMTKYGVDEKLVYTRKTYYEYSKRFSININTEFTREFQKKILINILRNTLSILRIRIPIKYFLSEKN